MELSNEPELHFQAGPTFLSSDVTQQVVVLHPWCDEHVSLILPRLLILRKRNAECKNSDVRKFMNKRM